MSVFKDKKFEELDWVSQAIEPIDSPLNIYLSQLPDEVDINYDMYIKCIRESGYSTSISVEQIISPMLRSHANRHLSYQEIDMIIRCFALELSGDSVLIDFEKQEISGGAIKLVKIQFTLDEKDLKNTLGSNGIRAISEIRRSSLPEGLSRANEILDLLGSCEKGFKTRSIGNKCYMISTRVKNLLSNDEWKIKDTELANKIGKWIALYIQDGNLAALSNLCRLKVMTHRDQPIYSMEEIL
jgi:hypothetical protein